MNKYVIENFKKYLKVVLCVKFYLQCLETILKIVKCKYLETILKIVL